MMLITTHPSTDDGGHIMAMTTVQPTRRTRLQHNASYTQGGQNDNNEYEEVDNAIMVARTVTTKTIKTTKTARTTHQR